MPTFLLFGKYSSRALQGLSVQRTDKAVDMKASVALTKLTGISPAMNVADFDKLLSEI